MASTTPTLTFGAFQLTQTNGSTRVLADGTSRGNPVPIEIVVRSWLQDGAIVAQQSYDNREMSVRVRFFGADLPALNALEASLFAELGKPNTLTIAFPNAPVSVFDVVTSHLDLDDAEDEGEGQDKPWRTYVVKLTALPFARSAAQFTSVALPATGTTTTDLDTCGAITGWTAAANGSPVSVSFVGGPPTVVTVTPGFLAASVVVMSKTFAATTTALKYLRIDWKPSPSGATLSAIGDGAALPKIAEAASTTSGYTRTWFYVAAASLAAVQIAVVPTVPSFAFVFSLDNVAITDARPGSGTTRQQIRSLDVPGSARTQGSLAIESATAALGDTLVYVYPRDTTTSGYSPPLRQFRTAGNAVTPDAAQVSGNTEPVNGGSGITIGVPIGLFPTGSYLLMGRMATAAGGTPTISWTTKTLLAGTSVDSGTTGSMAITTTAAYQIYALGRLQLPTVDLDPASASAGAVMNLTVTASAAVTYDEFWLFNTTIGRLIRVDCGTGAGTVGGNSRRLFIEPATVTTPRPTVRIGHSADRSDSHYPAGSFPSWQPPEFKPPQVNVLVVTPNATDASIALSGYARHHSNATS